MFLNHPMYFWPFWKTLVLYNEVLTRLISNCWKLYFSREQFCRSIQRLPVSTPTCNVHRSIRGRPLEQQWSIQQLGESNTTAIISHLIELWTIFFTFLLLFLLGNPQKLGRVCPSSPLGVHASMKSVHVLW